MQGFIVTVSKGSC